MRLLQRWQPLRSLPVRVALFVLLAALARGLVLGGLALGAGGGDDSLAAVAERTAARVDAWVTLARAQLEGAARDRLLADTLAELRGPSGARRSDALRAALGRLLEEATLLDGLWLTDGEGVLLRALGKSPLAPGRFSAVEWSGGVRAVAAGGGRVLVASAPVPAPRGGTLAWLHGRFGPAFAQALLPAEVIAGVGGVFVLDAAGGSIVGAPPQAAEAARALVTPAAEEAQGGGPQGVRGATRRLETVAGFVAVLPGPGAAAGGPSWRLLAAELLVLLGIAAVAWALTARLVRPLERLLDGARRIAQGDYDLSVPETQRGDEIGELIRTFNSMAQQLHENQREIDAAHRQLRIQNEALQSANEVLAQLSITDGLTKLHNHRFFQEQLTREIKRVNRTGEPLCMLLADIDDFKQLNDRLGHDVGDAVLLGIAQILRNTVRESDLLARYGGEEFVILTSACDLEGAVSLAEKIRLAVADSALALDDGKHPVYATLSIGVAPYNSDRRAFFRDADRALYRAKAEGKNCVVAHGA